MRLGISSYSYVWSVGVPGYPQPEQPMTPWQLLQEAHRLEVRVVQIADNLPLNGFSPAELERLLAEARRLHIDLELGTCGASPEHLRHCLHLAVQLHSPLLRVVLDTDEHHPTADEALEALRCVAPDFERAGVCLAVENHDRFPASMLNWMMSELNSPAVGICLDTANSLGCGEGLDTLMRVLGRWVVNLHIKDFHVERLPHKKGFVVEGRPAGQGLLDIPQLLADLQAAGRDVSAIVELWPPLESTLEATLSKERLWVQESVHYLRQFIPV